MSARPASVGNFGQVDLVAVIARLAALPPLEYEQIREHEAKALGVRVAALDEEVKRARPTESGDKLGAEIRFEELEHWPEPVDSTELLDELSGIIQRYVIVSRSAVIAIALWVLFTYVHHTARVSPILAPGSPDMRCGKTTLLRLIDGLISRAVAVSNISSASLFRVVEKYEPVLLIDEADAFLKDNEELRGILNSGHTRGTAYVIRTVGDDHEPRRFRTWCPKVIALIGNLPRTLTDRSISIQMRRKRPDETITKLPLDVREMFQDVRRRCLRWATVEAPYLNSDPASPPGLNDRAADNWSTLFAIADTATGAWPKQAREVAVELSGAEDANEAAGIMLLADLRTLFADKKTCRMLSVDVVQELLKLEDRPWCEWYHGKAITSRQVARLLRPFGIHPKTLRALDGRGKGYELDQFTDTFARYLTGSIGDAVTTQENEMFSGNAIRDAGEFVTDEKLQKHPENEECHRVTVESPPEPEDGDPGPWAGAEGSQEEVF